MEQVIPRKRRKAGAPHEQRSLFPVPAGPAVEATPSDVRDSNSANSALPTVLCGSFRRDRDGLRRVFSELKLAGCEVLSPTSVEFVAERDGFAYSEGQGGMSVREIELAHLSAISRAAFVWLHLPDGYIGNSGLLELGAAQTAGVPVFSSEPPDDTTAAQFVQVVGSPAGAVTAVEEGYVANPGAPLAALQAYYARQATARGWDDESPRDCVLLLTEELGEVARAVRKISGLKRDKRSISAAAEELADIQLYLVHLATTLGIDIAEAVTRKEAINDARFRARSEVPA